MSMFKKETLLETASLIVEHNNASMSFIQRKLKYGYATAYVITQELQELGIIGQNIAGEVRKILVKNMDEVEEIFKGRGVE